MLWPLFPLRCGVLRYEETLYLILKSKFWYLFSTISLSLEASEPHFSPSVFLLGIQALTMYLSLLQLSTAAYTFITAVSGFGPQPRITEAPILARQDVASGFIGYISTQGFCT
jgi:hypothetical protein